MHRLTARILLILLLVSTFAPAALAVDGPPQHACCLRKMHSPSPGATLAAVHARDGNCCPPITTIHSAQVSSRTGVPAGLVREITSNPVPPTRHDSQPLNSHSGRAPPASSIA